MKKIVIAALVFIIFQVFVPVVFAVSSNTETYVIEIPFRATINEIGVVPDNQTHGAPDSNPVAGSVSFSRLVSGSYDGSNWELTTNLPVGVSVSYTGSGTLTAEFSELDNGGFLLAQTRIYPTTVKFSASTDSDPIERVFKFYPIVRINGAIPSGTYSGKVIITVTQDL